MLLHRLRLVHADEVGLRRHWLMENGSILCAHRAYVGRRVSHVIDTNIVIDRWSEQERWLAKETSCDGRVHELLTGVGKTCSLPVFVNGDGEDVIVVEWE